MRTVAGRASLALVALTLTDGCAGASAPAAATSARDGGIDAHAEVASDAAGGSDVALGSLTRNEASVVTDARETFVPVEANDASCSRDFLVTENAPPGSCSVTPADLACDASDQCHAQPIPSCFGYLAYAVNGASDAGCTGVPCKGVPPGKGGPPSGSGGLETEDCQTVTYLSQVGVKCVDQKCISFAMSD